MLTFEVSSFATAVTCGFTTSFATIISNSVSDVAFACTPFTEILSIPQSEEIVSIVNK